MTASLQRVHTAKRRAVALRYELADLHVELATLPRWRWLRRAVLRRRVESLCVECRKLDCLTDTGLDALV